MADATTHQPPPPADGRAHPGPDGLTEAVVRRAFVWCQDAATGHRYDVPAVRLPVDGVIPVDGYPLNFKPQARPGKPRPEWESDPTEPTETSRDADTTSGRPRGPKQPQAVN